MPLDVAPEVESTVREYAAAEGVSIDELLARHFPPRRVADDDPVLQFLNERLRQIENMTEVEEEQADAEWQKFKRGINENRRINGERLLYPEEPQL